MFFPDKHDIWVYHHKQNTDYTSSILQIYFTTFEFTGKQFSCLFGCFTSFSLLCSWKFLGNSSSCTSPYWIKATFPEENLSTGKNHSSFSASISLYSTQVPSRFDFLRVGA